VCCYGIVLLGYMSIFVALSGRLRREMHQFLHDLQIATPNRPPKLDLSGFSAAYAVLTIGELALVAVGVVFLVWQYHAARVARGVGYPARTSPAFGVGSWFIPVVNLWFPYWALADCLPPEHRLRPSVLSAWLAYIGAGFLSSVSSLTALFSAVAAVIILVLALASLAFAVTLGCRLITAVNDDHRQATQAWFS